MKKIKSRILRNYITPSGTVPFEEWMNGLKDPVTRHRIKTRLDRVEKGNYGDHKAVGDGVWELSFSFGAGFRIYYVDDDDVIVILLCGGNKSSQVNDIKTAKMYWKELLEKNHE